MKNKFYKECPVCDDGKVELTTKQKAEFNLPRHEIECGECEGKGFTVTEEGNELLKFLERMKIV